MAPITHEHSYWAREDQYVSILKDEQWCSRFVEAIGRARNAYKPAELTEQLQEFANQIRSALETDPNRTFTMAEHDAALESMLTFPQRRAEFIDKWLAEGAHCPVQWP